MECKIDNTVVGLLNASLIVSNIGRGLVNNLKLFYVSPFEKIYNFESYAGKIVEKLLKHYLNAQFF